jgi:Putative esterase
MRDAEGLAGAPWERPLAGALDRLVVDSELLAGNPLGDSSRRPLYVYRPPGVGPARAAGVAGAGGAGAGGGGARFGSERVPCVYVIQGYTGQVDMWLARSPLEPTMIERLDAMFAAGECPQAIVVFVDAWTSRGGAQFLNSSSTGRYMDYLCDEVVPFVDQRYPTLAGREHRGLAGKSSGGYGAMVVPMLRPDVFGALASHAGDALFEACYLRDFPLVARQLRDRFEGSYEFFFERLEGTDHFDWSLYGKPFEMYGYACAYSPDPDNPGQALLPFEISTGRVVEDVWERWLTHDPVRMAPRHADALRGLRRIYLDAGRGDEYFLDLGAQAFAEELTKLGVEHSLELFDGKHGGITYRYPGAIRELVLALR